MHKLEKRQAIEAAEKSGNADADPVSTDISILYILSLCSFLYHEPILTYLYN